jgi:hypothetical protein
VLDDAVDMLVPNPVSFIVQKVLIHGKRKAGKKPQDLLYIHDTLELFGGALDDLRSLWTQRVRPTLPARTARRAEDAAHALFERVTDPIREAVRIPQDRTLQPEVLRAACAYGISQIFGGKACSGREPS